MSIGLILIILLIIFLFGGFSGRFGGYGYGFGNGGIGVIGISQRTVENHRASIMKKTGSKSLPELARLALAAAASGTG